MSKEVHRIYFCKDGAILDTQIREGEDVTDTLKRCFKKITDLEAKLAESEKDRLMWQEMYKSADKQNKEICETDIYPLQEENQQLKQQLAEKEKLINDYADDLEKVANENADLVFKFAEKDKTIENLRIDLKDYQDLEEKISTKYDKVVEKLEKADQDKISFAVEQLTEIRDYVKECWGLDELEGKVRLDIAKKIRLKIEKLKEGK